jgi:hypothetical protein
MSWGIYKHILYPTTPGRTIQQSVWDIMGSEIASQYKDPQKSLAAEVIREAVRTCAIPSGSILAIKATGHWYGSPPIDMAGYHTPFQFHIDVEEIQVRE